MTIQDNTIIQPIPNEKLFECNKHNYAITRFLCVLKNVQQTQHGWYDISVVESSGGICYERCINE